MPLPKLPPAPAACGPESKVRVFFKKNAMLAAILFGIFFGILLGICLRFVHPFDQPKLHPKAVMLLNFPGELLIRIALMAIIPLIISSLVSGTASLEASVSGKIGLRTIVFYLSTTLLAAIQAIVFAMIIRPGKGQERPDVGNSSSSSKEVDTMYAMLDMIRDVFPDNLIKATLQSSNTDLKATKIRLARDNTTYTVDVPKLGHVDGVNILGLTVCSLGLGMLLSSMGKTAKPLVLMFDIVFKVIMKMLLGLMWIYPVGICFLLAASIVKIEDPVSNLHSMGMYVTTVLVGLFCHAVIVLPLLLWLFTRTNPVKYVQKAPKPLLTALATGSSSMTLPVTMAALTQIPEIDNHVIDLVCPLGSNINMDGTALCFIVQACFISLLRNLPLGIKEIISIVLVALGISVGAPGVPTGVPFMIIMFQTLSLPMEDLALLMTVDWALMRVRTMVNVWGDYIGVAIINRLSVKEIKKMTEIDDLEAMEKLNAKNKANEINEDTEV